MIAIIQALFCSLRQGLKTRAALHAEIVALRHQLLVLQRAKRSRNLRLSVADRLLWTWLAQLWSGWRSVLVVVKPETVIAWHRRGFRLYWSWKSRHPQGRPCAPREVIDLIRKMSLANPRWGAPRIHGEPLKLGFELSEATVAKYMAGRRSPPLQTWRTFLTNHMKDMVSSDFFVASLPTNRSLSGPATFRNYEALPSAGSWRGRLLTGRRSGVDRDQPSACAFDRD
jgi:putative transposase